LRRIQERGNAESELSMAVASRPRKRPSATKSEQSTSMPLLRRRPAWALLEKHFQKLKAVHLRQLFADDRERGESLAIEAAGLYLDYSKNRITDETLRLLLQLARESGLRDFRNGCAKTKPDLVVMPSGRQIFPFFCPPHHHRAQNSGCDYTA
jgi:hypothetical protein